MNVKKITNVILFKKIFKCDSFGKSFTQAGNLRVHIKTVQEGEKDFTCESCEKSFTQVDSLKGHIRNIHKGHKSENTHQNHSQIS